MMKANISLIPGITALVSAALIFSLYKLDEPRHEKSVRHCRIAMRNKKKNPKEVIPMRILTMKVWNICWD